MPSATAAARTGINYEEVRCKGYGISAAAIIVDCMTENRVSTVVEVRHAFPGSAATWVPRIR